MVKKSAPSDAAKEVARLVEAANRLRDDLDPESHDYSLDLEDLEHCCREALRLDPGCFEAAYLLADTHRVELADPSDETVALYEQAIRLGGERATSELWCGYAEVLIATRRLDEARTALEKAFAFEEPWLTAPELRQRLDRLAGEAAHRKPFDLDAVLAKRVADAAMRERLKKLYTEHAARFTVNDGGAKLARWCCEETSNLLVLGDAVAETIVFLSTGSESAEYLIVLGDLHARSVYLGKWTGAHLIVAGDLRVDELLVCNAKLEVLGDLHAKVVVNDNGWKESSDAVRVGGAVEVGQRIGFVEAKGAKPSASTPLVTCEFQDVFDKKVLKEIRPKMRAEKLNSPKTRINVNQVDFEDAIDYDAVQQRLLAGKPVLRRR
ncbi:MAG TPA: hypothetical protein VEB43_00850 [Anaeromyxobacter sp.]|nr:hypothetical protein [Anaeromyxobacter sp.]